MGCFFVILFKSALLNLHGPTSDDKEVEKLLPSSQEEQAQTTVTAFCLELYK